jgi:hypothetical protein
MDAFRELLRLSVVGQLALHPDHVGVWGIGDGSTHSALASSFESVESFPSSWGIPIKVDIDARKALSDGPTFRVAFSLRFLQVLVDQALLVDVHTSIDCINYGVLEQLQTGLGNPLIFDGLKVISKLSRAFRSKHQVIQRLEGRIGCTKNKSMISGVNCGSD